MPTRIDAARTIPAFTQAQLDLYAYGQLHLKQDEFSDVISASERTE